MSKNPWINFLKSFRARSENKKLSLKMAMKKASAEYKRKGPTKTKKKKPKKWNTPGARSHVMFAL
jgi:hypothetical protein